MHGADAILCTLQVQLVARQRPEPVPEGLPPHTAATDQNLGKSTHVNARWLTCCLLRKASFWRCIQSSLAARMSARSASRCASCTQQGPQSLKCYPTYPLHACKPRPTRLAAHKTAPSAANCHNAWPVQSEIWSDTFKQRLQDLKLRSRPCTVQQPGMKCDSA